MNPFCAAFVVAVVAAVVLGLTVNLAELFGESAHRIILTAPPASSPEAVGVFLATKFNATVVNASSFGNHTPSFSSSSSSSWILHDDDGGKFLNKAIRSGDFAKMLGPPTHIVLLEDNGDPKHYHEKTSKWIRAIEASFGPVPVIRVDASKTPEEVYAEVRRHGFLEFYYKSSRCGALCRAY